MTRSHQVSPVPEIGTPGLRWRGLETAYGKPTRARSWKRRIQPRGAYGALRQSSTLLNRLYAANPNAVAMQVYAAAIVYNAMRVAQSEAAAQLDLPPEEL